MLHGPQHRSKARGNIVAHVYEQAAGLSMERKFIDWIRRKNIDHSQKEIAHKIREALEGKSSLDVPQYVVDAASSIDPGYRTHLQSVISVLLSEHESEEVRRQNVSRAVSEAAQKRVLVRSTPSSHLEWTVEDLSELIRALRHSAAHNDHRGYRMREVIEILGVDALAMTPGYERVRSRIKKIRRSVAVLDVGTSVDATPLHPLPEARLTQLLGYKYSRSSDAAIDWNFIEKWMRADLYNYDRARSAASIKDLQKISRPTR